MNTLNMSGRFIVYVTNHEGLNGVLAFTVNG